METFGNILGQIFVSDNALEYNIQILSLKLNIYRYIHFIYIYHNIQQQQPAKKKKKTGDNLM